LPSCEQLMLEMASVPSVPRFKLTTRTWQEILVFFVNLVNDYVVPSHVNELRVVLHEQRLFDLRVDSKNVSEPLQ
jgi:hypothetical protein